MQTKKLGTSLMAIVAVAFVAIGTARADQPSKPGSEAAPPPNPDSVTPTETPPPPTETPVVTPPAPTGGAMPGWPNLAPGAVLIEGNITINMTKEFVGKPINIAPDIYYGVNDKLTIGLIHQPGFIATYGGGICVAGKKKIGPAEIDLCGDKVYNNVGLDLLYSLMNGGTAMSAHAAFLVNSLDPAIMRLNLGVAGNWRSGNIGLFFDPSIGIGLNKRDPVVTGTTATGGNKESIDIPFRLAFQATPTLSPFVDVGIRGPLDGFGDAYSVPLGFGALFGVNEKLTLGGEFLFPAVTSAVDLMGGSHTDFRYLNIFVNYRM